MVDKTQVQRDADRLFEAHRRAVFCYTDRLFACLMAFQWVGVIAAAIWISPRTWIGTTSSAHPHVIAAILLGTLISVPPIVFALRRPGELLTRHVIAVGQMMMSALLIHVTGGRIETHFHVFGSLAFLAFYRDWRVLLTATVVVATDHFVRGVFYPQSVFGVISASNWRWAEHAAWVVFEDIFLIAACVRGVAEMREIATRRAELQAERDGFEEAVSDRTADLEESVTRYQALSTAVPVGIFETDIHGDCVYTNPRWERITGLAHAASVGQGWAEVLDDGEARPLTERWREASAEGGEWSGEFEITRRDGSKRWVSVRARGLVHNGGTLVGHAGIIEDVTERREAEAEIRKARDIAEAATKAKSDFLANMSHEIRTPMNGVLGMTGLLEDTELSALQTEYVDTIRTSADHLLEVINDILDFSKVEAGMMPIEEIPFDPLVAMEDVADLLAPRAEAKGIELVLRCAADFPRRLLGDPGRLRQIVVNLMSNAIKFTREGHVLLEMECRRVRDDGIAELHFSVQDTGIGIPLNVQASLFDQFTQADTSTTRRFGGTGLGLAISKHLVERMGGEVGVVSEPDRGANFWFTLQLPLDRTPVPEHMSRLSPTRLKGKRALIVDDNEVNRRVLVERTALWGMTVEEACDGAEALGMLGDAAERGEPYDVVLLDYMMPGMDGEALARTMQSNPKLRGVPTLLLTSSGIHGEADRLRGVVTGYLVKPVHMSDLSESLGIVLSEEGWPQEALLTRHLLKEIRAKRKAEEEEKARGRTHFPFRLLLVEDTVINQKVATGVLKRLGARVDVAANGREGVDMLGQFPYDLILMDCQMPEMDGYEATAAIRERGDYKSRIPIVAMTADAMVGAEQRCLDAGMDDYISKPIKVDGLVKILDRWLPPTPAVPHEAAAAEAEAAAAEAEAAS